MHLCISLTHEIVLHLVVGDCGRLVKSLCLCLFAICPAFICLHPNSPCGAERFFFCMPGCLLREEAFCPLHSAADGAHGARGLYKVHQQYLQVKLTQAIMGHTHTSDGHSAAVTLNSIPPGSSDLPRGQASLKTDQPGNADGDRKSWRRLRADKKLGEGAAGQGHGIAFCAP